MSVTDTAQLQPYLTRFRLSEFRPGQEEVIRTVLSGRDCLCVMPTGGGKSLCYHWTLANQAKRSLANT